MARICGGVVTVSGSVSISWELHGSGGGLLRVTDSEERTTRTLEFPNALEAIGCFALLCSLSGSDPRDAERLH